MAVSAESIGLLFKIRADSKDAQDELKKFRKTFDDETKNVIGAGDRFRALGQSVGFSNSQMATIAKTAPMVGAGIGAVAAAAVGAGVALFALVKNASDTGSELFDLSKKTGLNAESLSALKFAAEQSGSSIGEASQAIVLFERRLGEAAQGNEKLRKFFIQLGIDIPASLADPNLALRELSRVLNGEMPAGFNRTTLATELMGRAGANLASTFDTIGADFDEFLDRARTLGVVLTEQDIKAADDFGDTLDALGSQATGIANKFALELAPSVTRAMEDIGVAMERHRTGVKTMLDGLGGVVEDYATKWSAVVAIIDRLAGGTPKVTTQIGDTEIPEGISGEDAVQYRNNKLRELGLDVPTDRSFSGPEGGPGALGPSEAETKKAEAAAAKARGEVAKALGIQADMRLKAATELAAEEYRQNGKLVELIGALKQAEADRWEARRTQFEMERTQIRIAADDVTLRDAQLETVNRQEQAAEQEHTLRMNELDRKRSADSLAELQKKHSNELALYDLRAREYIEKQKALAQAEVISYAEAQKRITAEQAQGFNKRREFLEAEKEAAKGNAEQVADYIQQLAVLKAQAAAFKREAGGAATSATIDDLDRLQEKINQINETLDRMYAARGEVSAGGATPSFGNVDLSTTKQGEGPVVDSSGMGTPPAGQWVTFGQVVSDVSRQIGEAVGVSGEVVTGVFNGIGAAISQTVSAFGGLAGVGKNLGEFTKAVVRNIAQMAAIQAIWEAAQGLAALALSFFWPSMAAKATLHFKAAALYGVVAGVAGAASAAMGGPSGGAGVAGSALGGSADAGGREDNRTRYMREQEEKDKNTRREDRRGASYSVEVPFMVDGRELTRAIVRVIRDGGSERDDLGRALA